jgi:hypothetical protein
MNVWFFFFFNNRVINLLIRPICNKLEVKEQKDFINKKTSNYQEDEHYQAFTNKNTLFIRPCYNVFRVSN